MRKLIRMAELAKSPLLWGGIASVAFFWMLDAGWLGHEFLPRYCAGHVVQYVETVLFFIALAALSIKALDVASQRHGLGGPLLGSIPEGGQTAAECEPLLARIRQLPAARQNHYFVRRLREALEHVYRRGSAETLDDHLKYLADRDGDRFHAGYALIRLIIWTVPILGFLGTVVGITMAIAALKVDAVQDSMMEVTAGLGVKFDTTALALSLSIILVFLQFFLDRAESGLLEEVNRRAEAELLGRFPQVAAGSDAQVVALRRLSETAGKQLQSALSAALAEGLKAHAQKLAAAEEAAAEKNRRQWGELQQNLDRAADALVATQKALVQKADVLGRAVEATGHVAKLEETLNRNLAALAGAKNFEDTVLSLAAAIHLLNTRLNPAASGTPAVHLEARRRTGQAA